jgi:seryl-tRNA synthetase
MILIKIPNLSLPEVPIGKDASANQVVKQWGTPPKFNFPFKVILTGN